METILNFEVRAGREIATINFDRESSLYVVLFDFAPNYREALAAEAVRGSTTRIRKRFQKYLSYQKKNAFLPLVASTNASLTHHGGKFK